MESHFALCTTAVLTEKQLNDKELTRWWADNGDLYLKEPRERNIVLLLDKHYIDFKFKYMDC